MDGFIARKVGARGFGFIQLGTPTTPGEDEWFFHRKDCDGNSPFNALREGDCVSFEEMQPKPEKGPRAVNVRLA